MEGVLRKVVYVGSHLEGIWDVISGVWYLEGDIRKLIRRSKISKMISS